MPSSARARHWSRCFPAPPPTAGIASGATISLGRAGAHGAGGVAACSGRGCALVARADAEAAPEKSSALARNLTCALLVQKNETAAELADFLQREGGLPAVAGSDLHVCTEQSARRRAPRTHASRGPFGRHAGVGAIADDAAGCVARRGETRQARGR